MNSNSAKPKRCPKCKRTDLTDFSTCRYCSQSYDKPFDQSEKRDWYSILEANQRIILLAACIICGCCGMQQVCVYLRSQGVRLHGRASAAAIPLAVGVFTVNKMIDSAQATINQETAVLASDAHNYEALIKRGDAYYTKFQNNLALDDYTAAIAARPDAREAYEKRAIIDDAMRNAEQADKDRKAATSLRW